MQTSSSPRESTYDAYGNDYTTKGCYAGAHARTFTGGFEKNAPPTEAGHTWLALKSVAHRGFHA
jgi:hypothetical protein